MIQCELKQTVSLATALWAQSVFLSSAYSFFPLCAACLSVDQASELR